MSWLVGTLVWTGALIAAVLIARRPVAQHFGPRAAYALWLLPLLRLALPPIVLPAWLALAAAPAPAAESMAVLVTVPVYPAEVAGQPAFDWTALVLALWLCGALVYASLRLASYFQLRRALLAQARVVGTAGKVRLVETPATASPLAFGVVDKVVALPPGFMAWPDRRARDLALAHELAHHRAHDLAFNFCALPLFALHWFNPLSLLGWRAMRRDQEAACDARVVEHRDRSDRAAYALLIASAAASPRAALAAPMACPVLGDNSIVHRLRNLTMTNPSQRRRRLGAVLVGAGVLLVPLTASISYAQDEAIEAPLPPAPPAPPLAPVAPRAPDAPLAPLDPTPPEAPRPPDGLPDRIIVDEVGDTRARHSFMVVHEDADGDHADAPKPGRKYRGVRVHNGKLTEKQLKDLEALDLKLDGLDTQLDRSITLPREEIDRLIVDSQRLARLSAVTVPHMPTIITDCDAKDAVSDTTDANGKRVIRICRQRIAGSSAVGLRAARAQIARQREMSEDTRKDVLERLDREIARLEATK